MKVIGHRGAAGLAPENSLRSVKTALDIGVDAVEFDIRVTSDSVIVLSHDDSLIRIFGVDQTISKSTMAELKRLKSLAGEPLATLDDVLKIATTTTLLIEGKGSNWAKPLADKLKAYKSKKLLIVISFNHIELHDFNRLCPQIRCYGLDHHSALDAINAARIFGFNGIDINYWTLNPLAYWLAKRHKLDIVVYTVNKPWLARILKIFYPKIAITTDIPQRLQFLR